jgi:anaerobic ribonucleoside-triphosphate reductase
MGELPDIPDQPQLFPDMEPPLNREPYKEPKLDADELAKFLQQAREDREHREKVRDRVKYEMKRAAVQEVFLLWDEEMAWAKRPDFKNIVQWMGKLDAPHLFAVIRRCAKIINQKTWNGYGNHDSAHKYVGDSVHQEAADLAGIPRVKKPKQPKKPNGGGQ